MKLRPIVKFILRESEERIHIRQQDVRPFKVWMDKNHVYKKGNKLYRDYVDEETGEEETIESSLAQLYTEFKTGNKQHEKKNRN